MKTKLVLAILVCVMLAGCQNQTISKQKDLLVSTDALFSASVKVATVFRAVGAYTPEEDAALDAIIQRTKVCLNQEAAYLKDPNNAPLPDWFGCSMSGIQQIINMTKGKGGI